MCLNVSVYPYFTRLRDLDVDKDPVLVLTCGHALAMSVLDRESMKAKALHKQHLREGLSDIAHCQGDLVRCPRCGRPATNLMRYGHQFKYLRLDEKIKSEQAALSEEMKDAQEQFDMVHGTLEKRKAHFLKLLLKTKAPPRASPPKIRRLGKPDRKSSPFPQSDFKFISKIYGIPAAHERAWRVLVEPLTLSIQRFTAVYHKVPTTVTKNVVDIAVEGLIRFETGTTIQHSRPSTREAVPEELRSKVLSILATRGYPWDGFVGFVLIDSIQKRIHVLFIILSLAFTALKEAGFWSGWYWFVEDVIKCTGIHVMMMAGIASRGKYKRRAMEARLMFLDLICKRALWTGLRPYLNNRDIVSVRNQIQQLQKQEMAEQVEVRTGCTEMGMAEHLLLATRLRVKMARAIKVVNRQTEAEPSDWGTEAISILLSTGSRNIC
ncbi:hypothetical protein BGX34_010979 [Mortierella sp. NVP85]|nr:hypothetical protein BGX34_010979 [Mortierella sp. NVP85]